MVYTIYRGFHFLWTGFFAFLIAFPIIVHSSLGSMEIEETIFLTLWILGALLLFSRRYNVFGIVFTLAPVIFVAPIFIFLLSI